MHRKLHSLLFPHNPFTPTAVLIDAGLDPDAKVIKAALATRNLQPEDVIAILLTHGHNDHFGSATAFPNAQVMAMSADVGPVEGTQPRSSILDPLLAANPTGLHVDHVLTDGELLTLGRLQVRVFAVPGHTTGSAAFLADGVLYLGDSADSKTDGTMLPAFWFVSQDTALNVASLKSLAKQLSPSSGEVKYLTFSHSAALEGFGAVVTGFGLVSLASVRKLAIAVMRHLGDARIDILILNSLDKGIKALICYNENSSRDPLVFLIK